MSIEHKFGLMLASVFVNVINLGCAQYNLQEPTIIPTVRAQTQIQKDQTSQREPDVINVSTPQEIVDEMLELAKVTKNDVIYDLGSGDGRIPITAAQKYNARGVGIDINPERIKEANANARYNGVTNRVKFLQQDLFTSDMSEATVVTLEGQPELNLKLRPQLLERLKPGTRILSHAFDMGEWKPNRVVQTKRGTRIYLWVVPEEIPANVRSNILENSSQFAPGYIHLINRLRMNNDVEEFEDIN
ncbi:MAG: methyltransferase domain-containing protein [Rivularia sp. (in: cyanobacteria)]